MFAKSLFLVGLCVVGVQAIGWDQSVRVKGRLMCGDKPANNTLVKLYDEDRTDPDDLMTEGYTDADGTFTLSGYTDEIGTIEPKLNVYHFCNSNQETKCPMKFTIRIPKEKITKGKEPKITHDVGELNLKESHPGQARDCVH